MKAPRVLRKAGTKFLHILQISFSSSKVKSTSRDFRLSQDRSRQINMEKLADAFL
jgi:hypothetical protein